MKTLHVPPNRLSKDWEKIKAKAVHPLPFNPQTVRLPHADCDQLTLLTLPKSHAR